MKLSEITIDATRLEEGAWVGDIPEMAGLRLRVRGANNAAYRRMQAKLLDAVPRSKRPGGRLDPAEQDRVTSTCLASTVLLDWEGLEDNDGSPLPYSKERAHEFLTNPAYRRFREGVIWASSIVADVDAEGEAEDVGNSSPSSAGS